MRRNENVEHIKLRYGNVQMLTNGWCHFVYRHRHFVSISDDSNGMVRITMPYIGKSNEYDKTTLEDVINETNRDVKFIKVVILKNGSISLNYDHKIMDGENMSDIIPHMVNTLCMASEFLITKLRSS